MMYNTYNSDNSFDPSSNTWADLKHSSVVSLEDNDNDEVFLTSKKASSRTILQSIQLDSDMFSLLSAGEGEVASLNRQEGSSNSLFLPQDKNNVVEVETLSPTPIGPACSVRVVNEFPLMQMASRYASSSSGTCNKARTDLLDCLRPLLMARREGGPPDPASLPQPMIKFHLPMDETTSASKRRQHELFLDVKQLACSSNKRQKKDVVIRMDNNDGGVPDDHSANSSMSCTSSSPPSSLGNGVKIRAHQSSQWNERYEELVQYKNEFGHCVVPYHYKQNTKLALWVKRQRHQYKLKQEGQHSTMSDVRQTALERLGFVWDSHKAVWEERINELVEYRTKYGHCNVPAKFAENSQLAIWVKCQRRQHKLFCAGERSNMTQARVDKLNEVGFVWDPRSQQF